MAGGRSDIIGLSAPAARIQSERAQEIQRIALLHAKQGTPEYFAILRRGLVVLAGQVENIERAGNNIPPLDTQRLLGPVSEIDRDADAQARTQAAIDQAKIGTRIVGGLVAEAGDFPETVAIVKNTSNTGCSGVLVAPDTVMTAAHCVCDLGLISGGDTGVLFTDNVNSNNAPMRKIDGSSVRIFHPDHDHDPEFCAYLASMKRIKATRDIAIFRLVSDQIAVPVPVRFATGSAVVAALSSPAGYSFIAVGFGASRRGAFGAYKLDDAGLKKFAYMPVSLICKSGNTCAGSMTNCVRCLPEREFVLFDTAYSVDTCGGDSGGPIFVYEGSGTLAEKKRLAGITSRAVDPNGICGPGGIYGFAHTGEVLKWLERNNVSVATNP